MRRFGEFVFGKLCNIIDLIPSILFKFDVSQATNIMQSLQHLLVKITPFELGQNPQNVKFVKANFLGHP